MKTLLSFCIIIFFIITVPLMTIAVSLKTAGYSAQYFKEYLNRNQVYEYLNSAVVDLINNSLSENPDDRALKLIAKETETMLTPDYIQNKAERLIDDTESWLIGKTQVTPVVSFADLKDKLLSKNPNFVKQLKSMEDEYQAKRPEIQNELNQAKLDDPSFTAPPLPDFKLSAFLENNAEIKLGRAVSFLKPVYFLLRFGPVILGLLLVFDLVLLYTFSSGISGKLTTLSLACFLAGGANQLIYIISIRLLPLWQTIMSDRLGQLRIINNYLNSITEPFFLSYTRNATKISLALVATGILMMAIKIIIGKKKKA